MAKKKSPECLTLAEHGEAWWREQGKEVPPNSESPEWDKMYFQWIDFAFNSLSFSGRVLPAREDVQNVDSANLPFWPD